jgi:hypothetical protein
MLGFIFAVLGLAGVAQSGGQAANADIVTLTRAEARCLLANRERYLRSGEELMFIRGDLCPIVNPTDEQLRRAARNSGPEENPASRTIVIERRHLPCFFARLQATSNRSAAARLKVNFAGCAQ